MSASVLTTENWPLTESPQDGKPERRDYQREGAGASNTGNNVFSQLQLAINKSQQDAQPEIKH
jgi:hypothetical protein